MELIFDRIAIDLPEGREICDPEAFIRKPLHLRIQWIMEHKISFFLRGAMVDTRSALNNYRKWSALRGATQSLRL